MKGSETALIVLKIFIILTPARVQAVTFSATISPACLPSDSAQSYAGQTATATGWGKLDYNDFTEAAYLQVILASDWLIVTILASHWLIVTILASHWLIVTILASHWLA